MSYINRTKAEAERYIPRIRVSFHTETACYQIESDGIGRGELSDPTKQLLNVNTSKSIQNPAGIFNLTFTGVEWADKIAPNDIVVICMGYKDGTQLDTVMVGLIDSVRQNMSLSDNSPNVITTVQGRDFGKLLIKPALKFYPELAPIKKDGGAYTEDELALKKWFLTEVGWITLLNYFSGIGTRTKGSPAQMLDIIMRNIFTKMVDTGWIAYREDKTGAPVKKRLKIGNIVRFQFAKTEFFSLPLYMSLNSYEGSVWNLMERGCPKPFLELFVDTRTQNELYNEDRTNMIVNEGIEASSGLKSSIADNSYESKGFEFGEDASKVVVIMRNTPFDASNWLELYKHEIEDSDILSRDISLSDEEHYNLFWAGIQLNPLGDDLKRVAPPEYDVDNIKKFGLSPLEITIEAMTIDEEDIDEAYPRVQIMTRQLNSKLKRWYKDNHLLYSGSVEVRGKGNYKIGQKLYIKSIDLVFYIEEVSQSFNLFEGWTTTLGLTRGQNPTKIQEDGVKNVKDKTNPGQPNKTTTSVKKHKVAKNENLYTIAYNYYKDANKWILIWKENKEMLIKRDERNRTDLGKWIYEGQILTIPQEE